MANAVAAASWSHALDVVGMALDVRVRALSVEPQDLRSGGEDRPGQREHDAEGQGGRKVGVAPRVDCGEPGGGNPSDEDGGEPGLRSRVTSDMRGSSDRCCKICLTSSVLYLARPCQVSFTGPLPPWPTSEDE